MGLGDWLRGQLNDTTYGDGWQARQQAAAADQALRFVAEQRAARYQQAQIQQMEEARKRQAVNDYFDDAVKLATGAGRYEGDQFIAPTLPTPPSGFPYRHEDIQALVGEAARASADKRRADALETQSKLERARSQIALDQARTKALNEPDPLKREKLLSDIAAQQSAIQFRDWTMAGGLTAPQQWGIAARIAGGGLDPSDVTGAGRGVFGPGFGASPPPPPAGSRQTPPRPAPPATPGQAPMPAALKAVGGKVKWQGRIWDWNQLPQEAQSEIWRRVGPQVPGQ